ncbi:MAG: long-chain-fatty-acid--CoA ligase [Rhodospirillaceae bacterium]|jgi:acyl-CoA synthetase (AMP-forming)/AMP-acid ligase II|nr:long-chain-fatty-acid--CoA ligase [Rhodospirillaceae bacterium]MBT4688026.1 long-chain-fatty-acid--CoA ligase [Rhodospirillaceae bacterium]MBT5083316.1 long-chain-fatty-acid--CoA ligase [Rhodospirillaceae bacterium]MBT5526208.1 long-chain-fatty-acid--CoA ligase [Rhodospirillaceae bacterium]MBT5882290.1 long-chain-fatty-acid--CoA ligase [Rhodospirillaceae bacterium]
MSAVIDPRFDFDFMADPIRRFAGERPDHPALIFEGRETTYAQLDQRSNQVANGLIAAGVEPGQRIAILAKNIDLFFEVYYGATKAGAVLVPINFRLAPPEIAFVVNDADAKVLFVAEEFADLALAVRGDTPGLNLVVALNGDHLAWRDSQGVDDPHREGTSTNTALQAYSSGTTGRPKGVELTHDNFIKFFPISLTTFGEWEADDVSLVAMPLFHVAGCVWAFCAFHVGATNVLLPEVDPPAILKSIEKYRITQVIFVPAVILFLIQTPGAAETDVSSVKMVLYGASPIPLPVLQQAMEIFDCGFAQLYGLTETTGAVTFLPPEDHDGSEKMKSCGKPMRGLQIRVVDEDDNDCAPGDVGEVIIAGPLIMKGYWNQPEETAKAVRNGWFYSGDAGYFDAEGYLYIHDRVKDMIVSGGENIYPAEVESALAGMAGIADLAVIGVPDEKWGESVKAIVVTKPGEALTADEIIAYARTQIAGYKIPRSVDFIAELPRNPSGKILKRELRKPYWDGHERQVN